MTPTALPNEEELVRRAQDGDRGAFGELYSAYLTPIYDFTLGMLRNRADAEDVTSEVFLKAVERMGSLKDPAAFKGWLYQIARNATLDVVDKRKRVTPVAEHFDSATTVDAPVVADPQEVAESADMREIVGAAAATLNPRDYSVYELVVRHGMNSAELAVALDVRQPYAYILMNRLKGSVAEALEATLLVRTSRDDCPELQAVLAKVGDEPTPRMRKAVTRHAKSCDVCGENRKVRASVPALMAGMAFAAPSAAFAAELTSKLDAHWDTHGPGSGSGSGGGGPTGGKALRRTVLAGAVTFLVAATVSLAAQQTIHEIESGPSPDPTPTPTATATPSVEPTAAPVGGGSAPRATAPPQTTRRPGGGVIVTTDEPDQTDDDDDDDDDGGIITPRPTKRPVPDPTPEPSTRAPVIPQ